MNFKSLKDEYSKCEMCPKLLESRSQVVFGSGSEDSKILFIGEAPGANEDKQGIPFCGMSGKILNQLLDEVGLSRDDVFITNTILCRPEKNRNPGKAEVENCRERLDKLILVMKPKVIVTIGNFATERIIQKKEITKLRGNIFDININGLDFKVVPVIHPAGYIYSGRNPEMFEKMKSDFRLIVELIK
jgi:uracil-DNA glycosylase